MWHMSLLLLKNIKDMTLSLYCIITHNDCIITAITTGLWRFTAIHCVITEVHCKFTKSTWLWPKTKEGLLHRFIVQIGIFWFWQTRSQTLPKYSPIAYNFSHKVAGCKKNDISIHWYQQCTFCQFSKSLRSSSFLLSMSWKNDGVLMKNDKFEQKWIPRKWKIDAK